jgi:hypothetical protein
MLPEDGTRLEDVIGDLQSEWGVPQYPQEYRITLKVAEPKEAKAQPAPASGALKREKAPAAPRIVADAEAVQPGSRRRRSRRRRRRRSA